MSNGIITDAPFKQTLHPFRINHLILLSHTNSWGYRYCQWNKCIDIRYSLDIHTSSIFRRVNYIMLANTSQKQSYFSLMNERINYSMYTSCAFILDHHTFVPAGVCKSHVIQYGRRRKCKTYC